MGKDFESAGLHTSVPPPNRESLHRCQTEMSSSSPSKRPADVKYLPLNVVFAEAAQIM
jgi:hypothetical protein